MNNSLAEKIEFQPMDNIIKLYHPTGESRKTSGVSSEVYAFKTYDDITRMLEVFDSHIANAKTPTNTKIWHRNKLMFILGINIALRGSDLSRLRWCDILNLDGSVKENTKIQPYKTRKTGKFVFIYFNNQSRKAIEDYLKLYPYEQLTDYVFESKKTNEGINPRQIWDVVKKAAKEAGIKQNIGSHSLRKTFGYWVWHDAENKEEALVLLMRIFNHSSTQVTLRYIGVEQEDLEKVYQQLNFGI